MSREYIQSNNCSYQINFHHSLDSHRTVSFLYKLKKNGFWYWNDTQECNTNMLSYETQFVLNSYIGRLTFSNWIHFKTLCNAHWNNYVPPISYNIITYIKLCMPDWFRHARCAPSTSHLQFTLPCQICGWQHNLWFNIPDSPGLVFLWTLSFTPRHAHKWDLLRQQPIQ